MTDPTTTSSSSTSTPAIDFFRELCVSREVQDPSRGHLPLTVWLAASDTESVPACTGGCCHPISGPLARDLIAACARLGETVVHLGASDHQLISAALTAGCLPVAVFTNTARVGVIWTRLARTHPTHDLEVTDLRITDLGDETPLADLADDAGLVVAEQVCEQPDRHPGWPSSPGAIKVHDITAAARLVKPGGHLAVVTGLYRHGGMVDPLPEIITRARKAGLVYLQHIIALRHPARGERIEPAHLCRGLAATHELQVCADLPASTRVHSDVLLFTRPRGLAGPPEPTARPAASTASPVAAGAFAQVGGGR
ncbi:hypothetical protein ACIA8R_52755 [Nonomuraea sp. NPDC051191]|uniref:hypothetical protein n=1 Tax=Nonomuraea sp. NPDC051191 TaxID=3364372 RepID=UPI00379AEA55